MAQPQHIPSEAISGTSRSATSSPRTHADSPPSEEGTDEPTDLDRTAEDATPSVRRRRSKARRGESGGPEPREKRKRSRVTPDQLAQLESFFAANRSPTAIRRKEISDLLGMTERQAQIWFQNRRAKAKLQAGNKGRTSTEPSPELPPTHTTADDPQLRERIHEDGPIRLLSCTDLAIGTWRRIATLQAKHDLLAYVCEAKRCVAWYVHCAGAGFKIEVPFEIITDATIDSISPGMAVVCLTLSRPPSFFLESRASVGSDSPATATRYWQPSADWTEDMQASKVLRHELVGVAAQLSHDLVERYQLGRRNTLQGYRAHPYVYNGDDAPFDTASGVHAPVPVAGQPAMYPQRRLEYLSKHHNMLSRRASEANISLHSSSHWDSSPAQLSSSHQYMQLHQRIPVWAENYSVVTAAPEPIVPYSVQSIDPTRHAGHTSPSPSSAGISPSFLNNFYAYGDLHGLSRRDSEQSFFSTSSGPTSSVSSTFDLPSPQAADLGSPGSRWGEPALVEPHPLYDPRGHDQMPGHVVPMGNHMGADGPSYGFDSPGSMPDKRYGERIPPSFSR